MREIVGELWETREKTLRYEERGKRGYICLLDGPSPYINMGDPFETNQNGKMGNLNLLWSINCVDLRWFTDDQIYHFLFMLKVELGIFCLCILLLITLWFRISGKQDWRLRGKLRWLTKVVAIFRSLTICYQ